MKVIAWLRNKYGQFREWQKENARAEGSYAEAEFNARFDAYHDYIKQRNREQEAAEERMAERVAERVVRKLREPVVHDGRVDIIFTGDTEADIEMIERIQGAFTDNLTKRYGHDRIQGEM